MAAPAYILMLARCRRSLQTWDIDGRESKRQTSRFPQLSVAQRCRGFSDEDMLQASDEGLAACYARMPLRVRSFSNHARQLQSSKPPGCCRICDSERSTRLALVPDKPRLSSLIQLHHLSFASDWPSFLLPRALRPERPLWLLAANSPSYCLLI